MPKIKKDIIKCKHPNSRKTLALTKHVNRAISRKKTKMGHYMKQNILAEKVAWFRDNLDPTVAQYSPKQIEGLILKYLSRFEEELQQIVIKHSIGDRKNRQHANREDIINLSKKREKEEYNTCGIEIPDITNIENLNVLRNWNGELRFLQNIKIRRISKKYLQQ